MTEVYLNNFQIVRPKHQRPQNELIGWLAQAHSYSEAQHSRSTPEELNRLEKLFQRYAVKENQIASRSFESVDVLASPAEARGIYAMSPQSPRGSFIQHKNEFFAARASEILEEFYGGDSATLRPDHLIHVTCTGYVAPSAAQKRVAAADWSKDTDITHAYHMGCYAALPAVRMACGFVQSHSSSPATTEKSFVADIVHTEMCSLHMDPSTHSPEQIVVQSLFADGHIKYSASAKKSQGVNLKVKAIAEKILPETEAAMTWVPSAWGMEMTLSREVPAKLKLEIKEFLNNLLTKAGIVLPDLGKAIFAVHPGGPKIIQSVQEVLELSDEQVRLSKKVLFERGNMSSATLPHVWEEIVRENPSHGSFVISFAFGPGLTLFGSVFEVVR